MYVALTVIADEILDVPSGPALFCCSDSVPDLQLRRYFRDPAERNPSTRPAAGRKHLCAHSKPDAPRAGTELSWRISDMADQ